jgi:membrane protein YqaA with SNARE-associated domain
MSEYAEITNWFSSVTIIFVYSFGCAIFSPLPSEAPMFLFPELSRFTVLVSCALGKSSGAYLVLISGGLRAFQDGTSDH